MNCPIGIPQPRRYAGPVTLFLLGLLTVALGGDPAPGDTNAVLTRPSGPSSPSGPLLSPASDTDPSVEKEYEKLLADDNAAQAEVDKWILDNNEFRAGGGGMPDSEMNRRIRERFDPVRGAYADFIARHPSHVRARIAYGSFLGDLRDDAGARIQWEKALELDPKNPAIFNNLAGRYGENGAPAKAFELYSKAMDLAPAEPLYCHNLADSIVAFRRSAMEFYGLAEQPLLEKILGLYSNASRMAPDNFPYASDLAQTYYGIKPFPADTALRAWTNAFKRASDDLEREGVCLHLARVKMLGGRFVEARAQLDSVTNQSYSALKDNLLATIQNRERTAASTNSPPAP